MHVEIWDHDTGAILYTGTVEPQVADPPLHLSDGCYFFDFLARETNGYIYIGPFNPAEVAT